MIKLLPPGLHVLLGDSAGGIFTRVFFARDRLLIDHDVLSCGPTPRCKDLAVWNQRRTEYWNGMVPGSASEQPASRFNLLQNAARLADAERVHLWAATGVSEQLFIAFAVQLVQHVGGDTSRIAIVQFESVDGQRVHGLGELDEPQMRAHPEPRPLSVDQAQQYLNAWAALTSSDPSDLASFARDHPEANRWLKLAMQLMTRRFPDCRSGLSYWDHALLSRVKARGPALSQIIGFTMAETYAQGDRLNIHRTEAEITPFGEDVLRGAASNHPVNPIDDWAGGTRLSSHEGSLWFNDGGRLVRA